MFDKDINWSYLAARWFVVQAPMTIMSRDLSFFYVTFEGKHHVVDFGNLFGSPLESPTTLWGPPELGGHVTLLRVIPPVTDPGFNAKLHQ